MHTTRSMGQLNKPDCICTPFGDLMGDDEALETFLNHSRHDIWRIECMKREETKRGRLMPKAEFKKMLEALKNIEDDDKPLRASVSTLW